MFSLLVLVFIALFTRSEGNAEVIRTSQIINHEIGGSQITFNLAELGDVALYQFKCVVRFHDGRDSIEKEPIIPRDRLSAICRLPSGISGTIVDIDLTISLPTVYTSIPFARYVTPTYTEVLSQTLFVDPSPLDKIKVTENWNANQLTLTWDTTYFEQFFNPGVKITLLLFVHFGKGFEPDEFGANIMASVVQNLGTTTVTLPAQTIAQLANVLHPYFYVLRPLATLSTDIFLTSLLFAPTLGMNEYAAQQTCSDWLRSAQVPAAKEIYPCPPCLCQVKLDTNFVEAEYPPQIVELANGTLNDHVLYYEAVPSQSGYAQTCSYSLLTKNLATTSPAQAGWIHYLSKQISYEYNYFYDVWPYVVCCLQSNSQEYCDLFHEKRPIDTGHVYKAEKPSSGCGDPHMTTFESVKYDFMGYGEFWLIRGPEGSDFGVQGRMSPVWANQKVSYYKAIAARDGNTTVQIELRDGKLITILNGKELQFTKLPVSLPMKSVYLLINSTRVDIRFQSGFSIIVLDNKGLFVDVYSRAAEHNRGKGFMGIFGNFDDNRDNDLTSQDGLVIPPTSQNLRDLSLLHHRFGMTWLTKRTESFFVYEQGKSWDDYVNVDFGPIAQYPDPATLPEEVRAICGDSLFCYYEYVGTGDLELAAETVVKEKESDEIRKEMEEKVPMCDTLNQPANGKVQVNGYLNGSLATYSCNKEYDFESGDRVRTCSSSKGQPQWTGSQPACIWTCKACLETTVFEFSHDPSDCSQFFLCYFGERILSYCPIGTYFDPKTLDCSANYKCIGAPGC